MFAPSEPRARAMQVTALAVMLALALVIPARSNADPEPARVQMAADLPDAPGVDAVKVRCLTCHGADIIKGQRLSKVAWEREIDKMIGWGAQVDTAERPVMIEYLTTQFGVRRPVPSPSEEAAAADLLSRCVTCHDMRPIEQQRLSAPGWIREIDKMIGWGASLRESEKTILSEYLAKKFGPER